MEKGFLAKPKSQWSERHSTLLLLGDLCVFAGKSPYISKLRHKQKGFRLASKAAKVRKSLASFLLCDLCVFAGTLLKFQKLRHKEKRLPRQAAKPQDPEKNLFFFLCVSASPR